MIFLGETYIKVYVLRIIFMIFHFFADFSKKLSRFLKKYDQNSTIYTGHPEPKNIIFRIFPRTKLVVIHGKIAKNQSHLAKFGCVNGAISIFQNLPSGNFMFLLNIIVDMH